MRLSHFVAGSLIVLLLLGATFLYFNPVGTNPAGNPSSNRVQSFIQKESRFQGLHFHEKNNQLQLLYLYSYEPISNRFAAIYIPPDIKIVSSSFANVRSLKQLYKSMSPASLSDELSIVLDVPIPFWSVSNGDDLARIVNLTGGTRLPSPESAANIDLTSPRKLPGRWVDGQMALDYVSLKPQGLGIQRVRYRHKTFFLGYLKWLNRQNNLLHDPRTVRRLSGLLRTNLTVTEMKRLMSLLLNLRADKIKFPAVRQQATSNKSRHLSADRTTNMLPRPLKKIIERAKPQKKIKVQVLNGAGIAGLAGDVRDYLQQYSRIDVVEVGNADRYNYKTTQIIDRSNNPQSAYRVKEILKHGQFKSEPSDQLMVDVTVIAGRDLNNFQFK